MSKLCYDAYHELQAIRETIDGKKKLSKEVIAFRGNGAPGDPDIMYGSISQSSIDQETVVGLQYKFLYVLNILQSSDSRVPEQSLEGIEVLKKSLEGMKVRWAKLK